MDSYVSAQGRQFDEEFVMKGGARHMRYMPSSKGSSVIRVVPCMAGGRPAPMVDSKDGRIGPEGLSNGFIELELAIYMGNKGYHMVCPRPVPGETKGMVHFFHDYIVDYQKSNPISCPPDWRRWQGMKHEGDHTKPDRVLTRPGKYLLVQGYLVAHSGEMCVDKDGRESPKWPVVLCLKPSAHREFFEKVYLPVDTNAPWSSVNNMLGDCMDLATGKLLEVAPYEATLEGNRKQIRYSVTTSDTYPLSAEDAMQVWAPWEDILDLHPTMDEVAIRLAQTFNATTVVKVFEGCPVYSRVCGNEVIQRMLAVENRVIVGSPQPPAYTQPAAPPAPAPAQRTQWPSMPAQPADDEGDDIEEAAPPVSSIGGSIQERLNAAKAKLGRG